MCVCFGIFIIYFSAFAWSGCDLMLTVKLIKTQMYYSNQIDFNELGSFFVHWFVNLLFTIPDTDTTDTLPEAIASDLIPSEIYS